MTAKEINNFQYSISWRTALIALALLMAVIGTAYWPTLKAMASIWWRSGTYAHGMLVPIISLWLIWLKRHTLACIAPRPSIWLAFPMAPLVFAWLLGELTSVNALTQFAAVAIIVASIVTLLGWTVSKAIAFPLAFLFLAVPIGDFLLPRLMEWTADFTVFAVRLSGIPLYREGQNFVIPSGNWSVVEACSGIRYLIASFTIGTLFAYLNYCSLKHRLIFVGISILVPIVANWLRAYMIVMLGHLSGNKLAVGVDHLIYGWVFFGVIIALMFAIGMRWSELPALDDEPMPSDGLSTLASTPWPTLFMLVLIVVAGPLVSYKLQNDKLPGQSSIALPASIGPWQATGSTGELLPAFLNPAQEIAATYQQGEQSVVVYIAYYQNQNYDTKLVSSSNVIITTTNQTWQLLGSKPQLLEANAGLSKVKSFTIRRKGTEERVTAWQWYWINGELTSSDIRAKWLIARSLLSGKGDRSAAIVIYAPANAAIASLPAFVNSALIELDRSLKAAE